MISQALFADRVTLVAGVKTPIYPPRPSQGVVVGNATAGDLQVHTSDADDLHYIGIAAGYPMDFPVKRPIFNSREVAFWLKAAVDGEAALVWD